MLNLFVLRTVFIISAALLEYRQKPKLQKEFLKILKKTSWPPVSIIIAAFNEERVISQTLDSLLNTDYPLFEIIIVNDGSKDKTKEIVQDYQSQYKFIKLYNNISNIGKAKSLNLGILHSRFDYIVTIDADTIFATKKTLKKLILPLLSKRISAVTCNLKVGNRYKTLTKWQNIEYVVGFNTIRRASHFFNCITVLSGAASAYKKQVLKSVGCFSNETITEDYDLALTLQKQGYKLAFEDSALALTEAPFTLQDLYKQRIRWLLGSLQCIWKHKDILFKPKNKFLSYIFFPDLILMNFILIFSPLYLLFCSLLMDLSIMTLLKYLLSVVTIELILTIFSYIMDSENEYELLQWIGQKIFSFFFFISLSIYFIYLLLLKKPIIWNQINRSGTWINQKS